MKISLIEQVKKYGIESFVLLAVFAVSWIGFGDYMLVLMLLPFFAALFF